jgi:uncharacterized membrane-anchored protein YjiN (DUF445 family)
MTPGPETRDEAQQLARLRAMKRLPLVLLARMMGLFFITLERPENWAGWVHAFAEAGMVGALADWFAVVALFRYPMGLPIPHTAIIPNRKNEIGDSMAQFVAEHFLHPEVVRKKLDSVNLAGNISDWLQTERGHERVVSFGVSAMRWMLGALHEERVRSFIKRLSGRHLAQVELAPLIGRTLEWLVEGGRHQQLFTQVLRSAIVLLADNREVIRGNVQRESPWWLPGFVDDRIVQQMLERIELLLFEMALDPEHAMRKEFTGKLEGWAHDLQHSNELKRWGEGFKQSMLDNDDLQNYMYTLWKDLANGLEKDLEDPQSTVRAQFGAVLQTWAEEMGRDEKLQDWLNVWLTGTIVALVDQNRHAIASLISDTVRGWDAADTSYRVELAIGRDLQFIRINGTLVGGLVGILIHSFKLL